MLTSRVSCEDSTYADASLDFVHKRENLRPLAIYRIDSEFLLCYDGGYHRFLYRVETLELCRVYRVRVLCQQERMAVTKGLHGVLGGLTNRIRYVQ